MEQAEIWRAVAAIKEALDREFHPDGYNVGFKARRAAGQTILHLHVHVIHGSPVTSPTRVAESAAP